MRKFCLFTVVFGMVTSSWAAADEVIEQIEVGKAYYQEGDLARALSELEFALNAVRTRLSSELMATLPKAPVLWTADKPSLESGTALFGTGLMVTRGYQEDKGDGQLTAELFLDSPMVQAFSAAFSSPVLIANDPSLERIHLHGIPALLKWHADRRQGELSISLGGRVLAKVVGQDLGDKTMMVEMMKAWDLDALKQAAGL